MSVFSSTCFCWNWLSMVFQTFLVHDLGFLQGVWSFGDVFVPFENPFLFDFGFVFWLILVIFWFSLTKRPSYARGSSFLNNFPVERDMGLKHWNHHLAFVAFFKLPSFRRSFWEYLLSLSLLHLLNEGIPGCFSLPERTLWLSISSGIPTSSWVSRV